mmetsp:Transcript_21549/g.52464  ORF Transcript_21549/g.52464 Transcript_21549/m.52464 type:complete len:207 (+) Transcript_21549:381-1001(+)
MVNAARLLGSAVIPVIDNMGIAPLGFAPRIQDFSSLNQARHHRLWSRMTAKCHCDSIPNSPAFSKGPAQTCASTYSLSAPSRASMALLLLSSDSLWVGVLSRPRDCRNSRTCSWMRDCNTLCLFTPVSSGWASPPPSKSPMHVKLSFTLPTFFPFFRKVTTRLIGNASSMISFLMQSSAEPSSSLMYPRLMGACCFRDTESTGFPW